MSEHQVMAVCVDDELVGDCDEQLSDVCLTFVEAFVRLAGGVIAGAKPAAIFSIPMRAYRQGRWRHMVRHALDEVLRAYAGALPRYGMRLVVLYRTNKRVFLMVWRPAQLAEILRDPTRMQILRESGYAGATVDELMGELRRRLLTYYTASPSACVVFPHEIGVFLGYPPEDVRGFMDGRPVTCKGPWHAYGDERVARRRFDALIAQERRCRVRYASGEPLKALFAT